VLRALTSSATSTFKP